MTIGLFDERAGSWKFILESIQLHRKNGVKGMAHTLIKDNKDHVVEFQTINIKSLQYAQAQRRSTQYWNINANEEVQWHDL